jgi:predicted RNA-binding protein with PIN domain
METILVDAYNLMHKVPELKVLLKQSQDICVDTMVAKLQGHFMGSGRKVVLVFDGHGQNRHMKNIEVKFSSTDITHDYGNADKLIKALIDKYRNKKLLKIVSSDNEIVWYARECGSKVQSSKSFWGELKDKKLKQRIANQDIDEKPQVVTRGELEYLLKEFTKKK